MGRTGWQEEGVILGPTLKRQNHKLWGAGPALYAVTSSPGAAGEEGVSRNPLPMPPTQVLSVTGPAGTGVHSPGRSPQSWDAGTPPWHGQGGGGCPVTTRWQDLEGQGREVASCAQTLPDARLHQAGTQ